MQSCCPRLQQLANVRPLVGQDVVVDGKTRSSTRPVFVLSRVLALGVFQGSTARFRELDRSTLVGKSDEEANGGGPGIIK
jgi:hypothetical protein